MNKDVCNVLKCIGVFVQSVCVVAEEIHSSLREDTPAISVIINNIINIVIISIIIFIGFTSKSP